MYRRSSRWGLTTLALVAGVTAMQAQETGQLSITVKDKSGAAIQGAKVTASSPTQIGGARVATTDSQGRARFQALYPGDFAVTVEANNFQTGTMKDVKVGISAVAAAEVRLAPAGQVVVEVVATAAAIDVTSTTSGARISNDLIDSLPTARTYTDAIRFAPGVIASPDAGANFVVAGSLGRDNTGVGGAKNNTYILDGVDTTNPQTGGAQSRFNSEIIQEQEIKVGGITADVAARGGGLVSNVVTKSGSNEWHGSVNYYFQNDSLRADRKPGVGLLNDKFKSFDTAFTIGGPILKDKWWFFASMQKINTTVDGAFQATASPTTVAKNAEQDDLLVFFKTNFQISTNHRVELSGTHNKSKDLSLGATTNIPGFDLDRDRNQKIFNLKYEGLFGDWLVVAKGFKFESDQVVSPKVRENRTDIIFPDSPFNGLPESDSKNNYEKQAGGVGWYSDNTSIRDGFSIDVSKFVGDLLGDHQFKGGFIAQNEKRNTILQHSGSGADYENLARGTANNLIYDDLVGNFGGAAWADDFYVVDAGALDSAAASNPLLANYLNNTLGGDPYSIPFQTPDPRNAAYGILQYRIAGLRYGNNAEVSRKSKDFYLQDTWTLPGNKWTLYAGVRVNKDSYYADTGKKLHSTETNIAPRLGLTYNHKAENKLKLYATWGRYFEPIKLDMVQFSGSFANARVEQMYIPFNGPIGTYNVNNWVTLRQRGGVETVDAVLAPTLQSPWTDELRVGIEMDLGKGWTFEGTYSNRQDKRIVEDFDLHVYVDPASMVPSAARLNQIILVHGGTTQYWTDLFRSYAYPLSHFGMTEIPANVNYVLANMVGAEREYDVINASVRRSDTGDGWTAFANYTFTDSNGNSLSSGDADFQGDVSRLDPRLPWMNGPVIGTSDHQFKGYLGYNVKDGWAKNFTFGATYTYVSGFHFSRGLGASGRILQGPFGSSTDAFDAYPGQRFGPEHKQLDLRVKYDFHFATRFKGEVFVDVFNFTNRQTASAIEESSNGVSGKQFGQPINWQAPRRFYLGARLTF